MRSYCSQTFSIQLPLVVRGTFHKLDQANKVTSLQASVDGTNIQDIKPKYRAQSPLFDLTLPKNNVFGLTEGPTKSVADGFWIILKPLPPGKHEVHFSGASVDFTSSGVQNFATEAKYHLTVSKINMSF